MSLPHIKTINLKEEFPEANKYFEAAAALHALGVTALIGATSKDVDNCLTTLRSENERLVAESADLRETNGRLAESLKELQSKLSRKGINKKSKDWDEEVTGHTHREKVRRVE